ncbi:alpha-D-ribose 1-methylphosphonate 5-triphosphate diphosphatase [Brevibacterium daeguense]|uniref:Alpha-D-ribose 1-methylphosphonate 5-triphosphate diphosphatase n=1 Tax=Brevibacterium daeguense TaxID=909936 RepID=A0ABP8EGN6_9MICO|nr:alpha-D-ribose 1-methylphosphonate 5-triphosphate diphosphatase [Brevibacterium daeguense]
MNPTVTRHAPDTTIEPSGAGKTAVTAAPQVWSLGRPSGTYTIRNVRAVLPDRLVDNASVFVRDGRIDGITEGGRNDSADVDGADLLLTPGLIDVHSDALEKERAPRANAEVPLDFAMASFEGRTVSAGITTMFHGAGFQHQLARGVERSVERALETCGVVDGTASYRVDHRVLHRLDILSEGGAATLARRLEGLPWSAAEAPPLVSHEDHTPGQGQYADVQGMKNTLIRADGLSEAEAEERVARLIAEGQANARIREDNLEWLGRLAAEGRIRLLGHDPDTAQAIDDLHARAGSVAEFPTTIEAAQRARELGMLIVAGAPNAVRGQSHSGNVSVAALAAAGLIDALASDYMPTSLLAGVHVLVGRGLLTLPEGISLITSGPAAVGGLDDRGVIAEGMLADFALIDDSIGAWPRVVTTLKAQP